MGNRNIIDSQSIFIKGYKLNPEIPNNMEINLHKREFQIIKGSVYSGKNQKSAGAVIEIAKLNCKSKKRTVLGYTLTDHAGEYAFSIKAEHQDTYELVVYMPLIK